MELHANDALIVVDVQNDFCPGGALAVKDGDHIIPIINRVLPHFDRPVFTRDWHTADHCSFAEGEPTFTDQSWPVHCVAETPGAAFHPDLTVPERAEIVSKGQNPDKEAYSGFDGTGLAESLRARGVERLFVCGLATDYCVKATALDGLNAGFDVVLIEDACRGVNVPEGSVDQALADLAAAGVRRIESKELL